ncbi:CocE/NonD family hydrolase [Nocardia takedensis]|uniref:CocE/NonD family hydrolase n=1 Tax=Nocardia takedensis TaxID=259390 RepID=UPI0002FE86E5|nr:CocE/NonD family hydrolase [Nocardia takedensis]
MVPKRGSGKVFRVASVVAAAVIVAAGLAVSASRTEDPDLAVASAREWTALHDGPQPFAEVRIESDVPITMSDGTILKANVYRPVDQAGAPPAERLPTIVTMTPYTKLSANLIDSALALPGLQRLALDFARGLNLSGTPISGFGDLVRALDSGTVQTMLGVDRQLIRSGYNLVMVDVRGTGFSQGAWDTLGAREQLDTREVIGWAAEQPWSNGAVGMSGGSYAGINQLRAAEDAPAPLKAIFPVEPGSDLMRDVVAPGGGVGLTFLPLWLNSVNQAKLIPDMASMLRGEFDWKWLNERLSDPMTNVDLLVQSLTTTSLDGMPDTLTAALDETSAFRQGILGRPERVTVPTFVYGGWHDIFANSATTLYNALPLPAGTTAPPPPAPAPAPAGTGTGASEGAGTQGAGTPTAAPTEQAAPAPVAPPTSRPPLVSEVAAPVASEAPAPAVVGAPRAPAGFAMKKLLVGDTYHANPGAGTGLAGAPPRLDVLQRVWLDYWLKGIDNGVDEFGPVVVHEQGGDWATLPSFPQPGTTHRRVHLAPEPSGSTEHSVHDGSLTANPSPVTEKLTVAPGLTTLCSRDAAQGSAGLLSFLDVCAKDSRIAETGALTFTSAPITEATVVSGPINVHLNTVHDATDGYWNVTINDVAPDGTSTVLSTGQLTASLRAIDETRSTRSANGDLTAPVNPITLASHSPVRPGEPVALDIAVIPTQAVLRPGHRLRVDVFAANVPKALAFRPMLDASELRPQHLLLDPAAPSFVNLPTDRPLP